MAAPHALQDHGTFFNRRKLVAHKPTAIPNGTTLTFGSSGHKLVVICEQTGRSTAGAFSSTCVWIASTDRQPHR